jgi:DNA polymerase-4
MKGDMELYSKYSHMITEIIQESNRSGERVSMSFIWYYGMDKFYGSYKWTTELSK